MNETTTDVNSDAPPENGTAPPAPAVPHAPFQFLVVDMPWPDMRTLQHGMLEFEIELPQPAIYQRAYRAEVLNRIMNRREQKLRVVWMTASRGDPLKTTFMLQGPDGVVGVPIDGSGPQLRETIIAPNGDPIALWQLPDRAGPEPVEGE